MHFSTRYSSYPALLPLDGTRALHGVHMNQSPFSHQQAFAPGICQAVVGHHSREGGQVLYLKGK